MTGEIVLDEETEQLTQSQATRRGETFQRRRLPGRQEQRYLCNLRIRPAEPIVQS
jgi:hypothetical protein